MIYRIIIVFFCIIICGSSGLSAQKNKQTKRVSPKEYYLDSVSMDGLAFRSIGPALTSGRISDIAVHPNNSREYIVASSSGGVWKTTNSGTTFKPVFDKEGSYSIGCVQYDPSNPEIVWVGTGENNNQRSVAYGDGVYKSINGGEDWKNMGLKTSEHIARIIVHPEHSDIVYVAAIGPLWSSGGERGVFKSIDGGESWKAILEIDEHTGVTDLVMDPTNPDILYASAFQRRRHVFTYLGGGPQSGIYKSTDGGDHWRKINNGLPEVDLGRIGLAISPANPDRLYATVEAAQGKSGTFRSENKGENWEKQSSYSTSGNYYQELVADPHNENILYAMDTWLHFSTDGGKTFKVLGEDFKHIDNHCMWIDPDISAHFLVGCDGGIYETWDGAKTWQFRANLPVTQFYKVAVDNDFPFYNIYGGTQDNFSLGGPSRSLTKHGITNREWFITHGGDGFESQIDPENPDIVYAQSQYGVLVRYDRKSGEELGIQPASRKGEPAYRWNWDAPLIASPHASGRIYFAANKVFRSDDYGNSWKVISEDLTRQINRNELKVMDRLWSFEAVAKNGSTSPYGTIVALDESKLDPELLVAGTDDGLIQITRDGGKSWQQIENIPGAPEQSYVNEVICSRFDKNVIYAAFNHHKFGDFKPYIFVSRDQGQSWISISSNLPERGSIYAIEEDHKDPSLLFCGTEFGVFFSNDQGTKWKALKAGLPTIAVRDIAIQEREDDLVLGTFGRGFFVLDDYSPLREISESNVGEKAYLFPVRDALLYEQSLPLGLPGKAFQGDDYYTGENLDAVAIFSYYLPKEYESLETKRRKREAEATKSGTDNHYPDYASLKAEREEGEFQLAFIITDTSGKEIRTLLEKPKKGIHRLQWDLRYATGSPINFSSPAFYNPFDLPPAGIRVAPGQYSLTMSLMQGGEKIFTSYARTFHVKALQNTVLPAKDLDAKLAFTKDVEELSRFMSGASLLISETRNKLKYIKEAIKHVQAPYAELMKEADALEQTLNEINYRLQGDPVKSILDIDQIPSPAARLGMIQYESATSTGSPTKTHLDSYIIAREEFKPIKEDLLKLVEEDLSALENKLEKLKAPYTPGRALNMLHGN